MSDATNKAVFLSYASQDAEAARRICEALRSGGVEVWFDADGGLEHGDEWDAKIRRQIKECVLFIPVISASTQARHEGYFRIEWELAAQRAMGIASGVPFILPVVIDDTRERGALVPDRFRAVQWTRLKGGDVTPEVKARFLKLWSHRTGVLKHEAAEEAKHSLLEAGTPHPAKPRSMAWMGGGLLLVIAVVTAAVLGARRSKPGPPSSPAVATATPGAAPESSPPSLSESRKLTLQARALIDDDWLAVRENFRIAGDLCERATKLDPADGEAWATWARVSFEMLRRNYESSTPLREAARSQAERAIRLAPKSIEARLAEAEGLVRSARKADAVQRLRALAEEAPLDARVARALANVVERTEATKIRLSHSSFAGRDPRPLADEGIALYHAQRFGDCDELLKRAQALAPSYDIYNFQLAYLIYVVGDLPEARLLLEKLPSQLLQEDVFAGLAAGLWVRLGDGEKALAVLRRVPRDYLEDSWFVAPKGLFTGYALRMSGRAAAADAEWKQALTVVEKRLATQPNGPPALGAKALLLALTGQKSEAENTWELARELGSSSKANRAYTRARIHVALSEKEEAIRELVAGLLPVTNGDTIAKVNMVRFEPDFESIRNDPRIQEMMAAGETRIRELRQKKSLSPDAPPPKSVAVLAFQNLSDDQANEYFSDGISEELINALGRVPGLTVKGSTSAFHFKGRPAAPAEIARQLGVTYLVRGSVRKAGNKVAIAARLTHASDDTLVWSSEPITRELGDVLALQQEIAGLIAQSLQLKLGPPRSALAVNPEAYRLYLEGRAAWNLRNAVSLERAEALFRRALELDPDFARAHSGLADIRVVSSPAKGEPRAHAVRAEIIAHAERAIALDPSLAEPHATLGCFENSEWNFEAAERHFQRSFAINSNYAWAHFWRSQSLVTQGRMGEALAESRLALDADPLAPRILSNHALLELLAGRPADAIASADLCLSLQPGNEQAQLWKGEALLMLGRGTEALKLARDTIANQPRRTGFTYVFARAGTAQEAAEALASPDGRFALPTRARLAAGPPGEAFAGLENDALTSIFAFQFVLFHPAYDAIRSDPRFTKMVEQARMTEAHRRAQAWRAANPPRKGEAQK